jgi:WD40 repeat protein
LQRSRDARKECFQMTTSHKPDSKSETGYTAFLSYSHAADPRLAPAIQSGLQRFGRPWYLWYLRRKLRVFRDTTSLSATPGLWPSIEHALGRSDAFIYLASPGAANSDWVRRELEFWREHRSSDRLFIVLTDGTIRWDPPARAYAADSDAIPDVLRDAFSDEPKHVDLRWARDAESLSLRHPRFRDAIAELVAALTGRAKDELVGEDVRRQRTGRRLALGLIAVLVALSVAALSFGLQWRSASIESARNAADATSRALAMDSLVQVETKPDLALLLAAEAYDHSPTQRALGALQNVLMSTRHMRRFLNYTTNASTISIDFDPSGERFAVLHSTDGSAIRVFRSSDLEEIWRSPVEVDHTGKEVRIPAPSTHLSLAFQAGSGLLFTAGQHGIATYDGSTGNEQPPVSLDPRLFPCSSIQFDSSGSHATWLAKRYVATLSVGHENIRLFAGAESPTVTAISADGSRIALADENIVRLWNFDPLHERIDGKFPFESALAGEWKIDEFGGINAIALDATGESLAVLSQRLHLFKVGSDTPSWSVSTKHANINKGVTFWPDENMVVTWGGGGSTGGVSISKWRIDDGVHHGNLLTGFEHNTTALAFSRDGLSMVSGDRAGQCIFWDFRGDPFVSSVTEVPQPEPTAAAFHPTQQRLFLGYGGGELLVFDYDQSAVGAPVSLATEDPVRWIKLDGHGSLLVVGTEGGKVRMLDSGTLESLAELDVEPGWKLTDVAIDTDGRQIAFSTITTPTVNGPSGDLSKPQVAEVKVGPDHTGRVYLFDAVTLRPRCQPIEVETATNLRLIFDASGEWLLLSQSFGVTICRTSDGTQMGTTWGSFGQAVQFLPDERVVYQRLEDNHLTLIDADKLRSWFKVPGRFPPDGIALEGHDDPVVAWALRPDGATLATSSYGGVIMLWDMKHGLRIGAELQAGNHVETMAFAPSGLELVALRKDGKIVTLDCNGNHWAAQAREVANRQMTSLERQRHGL